MTLIQRCALTVQLQPSIAHIPGGAHSTLPGRNTRHHNNTDHTIARSHISPFRALNNTLLLPLIFLDIQHDDPPTQGNKRPRCSTTAIDRLFDSLAALISLTSFHRAPLLERRPHFHRSGSSYLLLEVGHICLRRREARLSPEKLLSNTLLLDAPMRTEIKTLDESLDSGTLTRNIDPVDRPVGTRVKSKRERKREKERSEVDGKSLERIPAASQSKHARGRRLVSDEVGQLEAS